MRGSSRRTRTSAMRLEIDARSASTSPQGEPYSAFRGNGQSTMSSSRFSATTPEPWARSRFSSRRSFRTCFAAASEVHDAATEGRCSPVLQPMKIRAPTTRSMLWLNGTTAATQRAERSLPRDRTVRTGARRSRTTLIAVQRDHLLPRRVARYFRTISRERARVEEWLVLEQNSARVLRQPARSSRPSASRSASAELAAVAPRLRAECHGALGIIASSPAVQAARRKPYAGRIRA